MSKGMKIFLGILAGLLILVFILYSSFKSTYNSLVSLDEQINATWAQVQNVYQRRADLIPNLVETVKGYASHERETLEAVVQARASATRPELKVDPQQLLQNPQLFQQFEQAQGQLTSALGRLMVVVERYPDLKANINFIRLQDELAGTENRIAVERRRYIEAVRNYNQRVRSFPTNLFAGMFGFEPKPTFEASSEAQEAPKVDFSSSNNQN